MIKCRTVEGPKNGPRIERTYVNHDCLMRAVRSGYVRKLRAAHWPELLGEREDATHA